jgi:hypothetical protein
MDNKLMRQAFIGHLENLVYEKQLDPQTMVKIIESFDSVVRDRELSITDVLTNKIRNWEDTMEGDDKSLYTLGLRHAIDAIRGLQPTNSKEYKPIDEEDFRS